MAVIPSPPTAFAIRCQRFVEFRQEASEVLRLLRAVRQQIAEYPRRDEAHRRGIAGRSRLPGLDEVTPQLLAASSRRSAALATLSAGVVI
jgi:hypothetical protein